MDGSQFDDLSRALSRSRRTVLGTVLAAASGAAGLSSINAKKKKKKCAKKCKDGCCTSKTGKCINPAQQTATQCGTGGEICRRTGCGGGNETTCSAANCSGCCDDKTCVTATSEAQCGSNGAACVTCSSDELCHGTCCRLPQKACGAGAPACCFGQCQNGACCQPNGENCTANEDCCDSANSICESGKCVAKTGSACEPGWMCQAPDLSCPGSGICGGPNDCTQACANFGHCTPYTCLGDPFCCPANVTESCNEPEMICECIIEGGYCTRI